MTTTISAPRVGAGAADRGIFTRDTDTVLAFSDGLDGILLVDLDASRAVRRPVDGALLATTGPDPSKGNLVVSNFTFASVVPASGGASRPLGSAQLAFAASGTADTWLVEFVGGTSVGPFRFRLVTPEGVVRATVTPTSPELDPFLTYPVAAVGRTIAFDSPSGLRLWDTESGSVTILGSEAALVGQPSSSGRFLPWCTNSCTELHVADLAGSRGFIVDKVVASTHGRPFDLRNGSVSPHGRYLAVVRGGRTRSISPRARGDLVLVDLLYATTTVVADGIPRSSMAAWSPNGRTVFFVDYAYERPATSLGRFDLDRREVERVQLPLQSVSRPTAFRRDAVEGLLTASEARAIELTTSERSHEEVDSDVCFVTTRVGVGIGGAGGLYTGDPFGAPAEGTLSVYLPNTGVAIAGTRPDGMHDFTFFWMGPTGTETVDITGRLINGPKDATFELVASRRIALVSDPGCWRFTGRTGNEALTVTVLVHSAEDSG